MPRKITDLERLDRSVPEADLLANVLALARGLGWWAYHTHDSRRSEPGWPDVALIRQGRLVLAELKRQTEKPTDAQRLCLDSLALVAAHSNRAVEVHVWRPSDWRDGTIERMLRD